MEKKYCSPNKQEIYKNIEIIDNKILNLYRYLDYKKLFFPIQVSEEILQKIDYIKSFGQYLIRAEYLGNSPIYHRKYLNPAACLQVYPFLAGKYENDFAVTTKNKCFRNELSTDEFIRLNEFTMREFVLFASDNDELVKKRDKAMQIFSNFLNNHSVEFRIAQASDHFSDPDNKLKILQKISKAKYEFLVKVASKEFAIASFNLHGNHFTHSFEIQNMNNSELYSGCFAFGLERISYILKFNKR